MPGLAIFAVFVAQQSIAPLLVPLGRGSGLTDQNIGAIMAGSSVTFVVGSLLWGRLAGRAAPTRMLAGGFAGATAGLLVFGTAIGLAWNNVVDSDLAFWVALFGRSIVFGLAASAVPVVAQSLALTNRDIRIRQRAVANIGLGYSLSGIIGPALGAALFALSPLAPLWAAPLLLAAIGSTVVVTTRKFLPPRAHPVRSPRQSRRNSESAIGLRARLLLIVGFLLWSGSNTVVVLFPFLLQDTFALSTSDTARAIGVSLTAAAMAGIAAQFGVTRRWTQSPPLLAGVGTVVQLAGITVLILAPTPVVVGIGVVINGLGSALSVPGYTLWIGSVVAPGSQARLAGYMEAVNSIAATLVPVVGIAAYHWSTTAPFLGAATCFIAVAAWATLATVRRRRPLPPVRQMTTTPCDTD